MLPIIGNIVESLPVVGDVVETITGGDDKNPGAAALGKALEKVADKDPELAKELAYALTETLQEEGKGGDGEMPKELAGILKGAADVFANLIPGGNLVKGILGKIF